jgi:hypothetical protein
MALLIHHLLVVQLLLLLVVVQVYGLTIQSPPPQSQSSHTALPLPLTSSQPQSAKKRRSGKSSFLYKQEQQQKLLVEADEDYIDNTSSISSSAFAAAAEEICLLGLAQKHSNKRAGSSQYKKAWAHWLSAAVELIRDDLGSNLLSVGGLLSNSNNTNNNTTDDIMMNQKVTEEFEKLFFDLGVAADIGIMPSFQNQQARIGYSLEFFCRARSLAEFFLETNADIINAADQHNNGNKKKYPKFWSNTLINNECPILASSSSSSPLSPSLSSETTTMYEIVSLGGGPGFDFVGVALAATFSWYAQSNGNDNDNSCNINMHIHVSVLDYEEGWKDLVNAMDGSTRKLLTTVPVPSSSLSTATIIPSLSCDWGGKCDITKSLLHDPVNVHCLKLVHGRGDEETSNSNDDEDGTAQPPPTASPAKLWICQYCVAENAELLRKSNFVFFKELIEVIPVGTLLLLTEVVPRLWPEFVHQLDNDGLLSYVDIGFCKGYHGKQFMLQKRATIESESSSKSCSDDDNQGLFEQFDHRTREQLIHFERISVCHDRKVQSGWERQERKANESAEYHCEQERRKRNTRK